MTDRALLEAAAKAAGYKEFDKINGRYAIRLRYDGLQDWSPWNPLQDDGDALRLAHVVPMIVTPGTARLLDGRLFGADTNDTSATRRAIVRAAAAMAGKA